ncbi:hypothetical protein [Streptomyces sp. G1]|uniref:hypothetical protein n=1 Tax=Streptomyces sp. G1 TaxID=361572 RepID=UPI002030A809|nr:hypothetical protein [Streptomyces sp. G1]MCM1967771.1 hypothetical protein [Streptomyces sp. G1]
MPEITYQAAWTPEDQEVTLIQNIRAGISGPFGDWPAATRDEAVRVLAAQGYLLTADWTLSPRGDHWADLIRIEG